MSSRFYVHVCNSVCGLPAIDDLQCVQTDGRNCTFPLGWWSVPNAGSTIALLPCYIFLLFFLRIRKDATQLRSEGHSGGSLRRSGFNASELKNAGFDNYELNRSGLNAQECAGIGLTARDLKEGGFGGAGFEPVELREASYTASDLRSSGFVTEPRTLLVSMRLKSMDGRTGAVGMTATITAAAAAALSPVSASFLDNAIPAGVSPPLSK